MVQKIKSHVASYLISARGPTLPKKCTRFQISGFHGRFWDFSEDFKISLEISRFRLRFRDFTEQRFRDFTDRDFNRFFWISSIPGAWHGIG